MGWKKLLYNPITTGTFTIEEPASWSRTPCSLYGTDLTELGITLSIRGIGDYWQSDTFIYNSSSDKSIMIKRRIEKRLEQYDVLNLETTPIKIAPEKISSHINEWLILEIDMETAEVKYYFSKEKI